jgi:hypothetical protein
MPTTATIPAIVGASQVVRRPHCAFETKIGPIELMVEAAVAAADDAGDAASASCAQLPFEHLPGSATNI